MHKTDSRLDIFKFIMAIMIVALHTMLWPDILMPWLRIAVPLFFMISSYLFFHKIDMLTTAQSKRRALVKFIQRNLILYFFWFVVTFPATMFIREWNEMGLMQCVGSILYNFFLGSTFVASWFIVANIIATCIVFYLRRYGIIIFILGLVFFVICCMTTSYYSAFPHINDFFETKLHGFEPCFSFFAGILWVWLGQLKCLSTPSAMSSWKVYVLLVVGCVLLWIENNYVGARELSKGNDGLLSLLIVCPMLFAWVFKMPEYSRSYSITLRKASTIFYCLHGTIARGLLFFCRLKYGVDGDYGLVVFIITMSVCILSSVVILKLSKTTWFKWLKYSY